MKLPIILIGPMATGKSTIANELAKLTAVPRIVKMNNQQMPRKRRMSPERLEKKCKGLTKEATKGIRELAIHGPAGDQLTQKELERRGLIQQVLKQLIRQNLLYYDAKRTMPTEAFPQVEKSLSKEFEGTELKNMMKQEKVASRRELDQRLRARGSSLEREKKAFMQHILSQHWLGNQIDRKEEVTHEQMLDYYRRHGEDFDHPSRAKWKELMARFSKYRTEQEAGAAIAQMGNRAFSAMPFEEVAKAHSHGVTATEGGVRDWTTQGSLVSEVLDRELFNPKLPVGRLSPILKSKDGFHIIVVTEREFAHRTPFQEVQADIQSKIRRERSEMQIREYTAKVRDQIPVWTIFDNPPTRRELTERQRYPRR